MEGLAPWTDEQPGVMTAAYELAAVIWQVHDDAGAVSQAAREPLDGHVVAHIKARRPRKKPPFQWSLGGQATSLCVA